MKRRNGGIMSWAEYAVDTPALPKAGVGRGRRWCFNKGLMVTFFSIHRKDNFPSRVNLRKKINRYKEKVK